MNTNAPHVCDFDFACGNMVSGEIPERAATIEPIETRPHAKRVDSDAPLTSIPKGFELVPAFEGSDFKVWAPDGSAEAPRFFSARDIALAMGVNKKQVHRTAQREGWPTRSSGNKLEYCPPAAIAAVIIAAPASASPHLRSERSVTFADLAHSDDQRNVVLMREKAVQCLQNNLHLGKEIALELVAHKFKTEQPLFRISVSSLRRWFDAYQLAGIDGLVEQKRGRVGRKAFATDLSDDEILRGRAAAIEHGIKGRLNVARAFRQLASDPTITGPARTWLHGARASKSTVPPSVRDALRTAPLATRLIQQGPKAAKLAGPYTECSYENVPAGKAFTADDMTANVYVWTEWPNEDGYLLIRPQILAAMDIGAMRWQSVRAVIRPKGQYNKDDVWGLIGDVLDTYGRYDIAVLEGGTWQSDVVIGQKTGLSDEARFGGLKSLGVQVIHTRTPRGKIIETAFNSLQHAADACRGFCGRMEMKDCPEDVKRQLAEVRSGLSHPRQYFLHLNEYIAHLAGVMAALNNERNDGKILRGLCPDDKWTQDNPQLEAFPDSAKWLYRSSYRIETVTRNGVRVTMGTGKFQQSYTYSNPEVLEEHRGRRVVIFWNDYDPDTAAVIYTIRNGKPHQFLCVASRVKSLPRFGASEDQMATEAARKKLSHQLAVTQSRSLAPYLQRKARSLPVQSVRNDIAERIAAAREEAEQKKRQQAERRRTVQRAEVTAEDAAAATEILSTEHPRHADASAEEISNLFAADRLPDQVIEDNPF
jgi:hypothetical protein